MAEKKTDMPVEPEELTPSQHALKVAGTPKDDESDEDLNKRAAKYAQAKRKARWG